MKVIISGFLSEVIQKEASKLVGKVNMKDQISRYLSQENQVCLLINNIVHQTLENQ